MTTLDSSALHKATASSAKGIIYHAGHMEADDATQIVARLKFPCPINPPVMARIASDVEAGLKKAGFSAPAGFSLGEANFNNDQFSYKLNVPEGATLETIKRMQEQVAKVLEDATGNQPKIIDGYQGSYAESNERVKGHLPDSERGQCDLIAQLPASGNKASSLSV